MPPAVLCEVAPPNELEVPFDNAPPRELCDVAPPSELDGPCEVEPPEEFGVPFDNAPPRGLCDVAPPGELDVPFEVAPPKECGIPFDVAPPREVCGVAPPGELDVSFDDAPPEELAVAAPGELDMLWGATLPGELDRPLPEPGEAAAAPSSEAAGALGAWLPSAGPVDVVLPPDDRAPPGWEVVESPAAVPVPGFVPGPEETVPGVVPGAEFCAPAAEFTSGRSAPACGPVMGGRVPVPGRVAPGFVSEVFEIEGGVTRAPGSQVPGSLSWSEECRGTLSPELLLGRGRLILGTMEPDVLANGSGLTNCAGLAYVEGWRRSSGLQCVPGPYSLNACCARSLDEAEKVCATMLYACVPE